MNKKNQKNLEMYKKVGAEMRLLKSIYLKLLTDICPLLHSKDTDKLLKVSDDISRVCCRVDDYMFKGFPEISNEYVDVFYGSLNKPARNDVDKEIIELAKQISIELFEPDKRKEQ